MRTPEEIAREVLAARDAAYKPPTDECSVMPHDEMAEIAVEKVLESWAAEVRADAEDVERRLSALLCNLTGGLLSKTGYDVRTMEQAVEDYFEREVVEPVRAEVRAETLDEAASDRRWRHPEHRHVREWLRDRAKAEP